MPLTATELTYLIDRAGRLAESAESREHRHIIIDLAEVAAIYRAIVRAGELPPSATPAPQIWEYKTHRVRDEPIGGQIGAINTIGAAGWELVGIQGERLWFKRAMPND